MLIVSYSRDERFLARAPFEIHLDPELVEIDHLLDDPQLILQASNDLAQSAPQALWNGRPSTPVVVILRLSVVRRLMGWSYETCFQEVDGSVKWRWFCRIDDHPVPNHSTQQTREALIRPETLQRLNQRVVQLAYAHGVTDGKKLRSDSTVIETNIHYPTDSRLLSDSARVLGRLLGYARELLTPQSATEKPLFRNRSRRARRLARQIGQRLRSKNGQKKPPNVAKPLYRQLVKVVAQMLAQAQAVEERLRQRKSQRAKVIAESLAHYVPLVRGVIVQTTRRVLEQRHVSARDKIVSLFEPHTAIIQRGKAPPHETEFGRKLWYSEVDGGIISEYRILTGNPPDAPQWLRSIQGHRRLFGHAPHIATADRGVFSPRKCSRGASVGRAQGGTATSRCQELATETAGSPAVVQSGTPLSEWNRRTDQWLEAGAPA
jgi:IS5 family transposase